MRVIFFLLVCSSGFLLPWWVLLLCAVAYAVRYTAYELVVLGIFLDASYGVETVVGPFSVPFPCVYTAFALMLVCSITYIRPSLRMSSRVS